MVPTNGCNQDNIQTSIKYPERSRPCRVTGHVDHRCKLRVNTQHTAGVEQVYDFRTREIGTFVFGGINIGTNQINALFGKSIGVDAGVYLALGWQHFTIQACLRL